MAEEKKERKPRASIEEMLKLEFGKIQKLYARQAKAQAKDSKCGDVEEAPENNVKKEALDIIDDIVLNLKKLRKAVKKI